jgi:hypothetical protein
MEERKGKTQDLLQFDEAEQSNITIQWLWIIVISISL